LPPGRGGNPVEVVAQWRERSRAEHLSARELIKAVYSDNPLVGSAVPGTSVIGTPSAIADFIESWLDSRAADGFVIAPDVIPTSLDDFVDRVVPVLQDRGLLRTQYTQPTLGIGARS
jgi:alkanesulfonate monooxygenase SsuD/methylene tetrahydromethanopterin reductase-like flavin-dependent oxidoreductase (luciferase family)